MGALRPVLHRLVLRQVVRPVLHRLVLHLVHPVLHRLVLRLVLRRHRREEVEVLRRRHRREELEVRLRLLRVRLAQRAEPLRLQPLKGTQCENSYVSYLNSNPL